ncbi:hypothetical protein MRX96_057715 [Rhipicephalus microplus]
MRQGDTEYFHKYYRILPHKFHFILRLLQKDLERKHAVREPISPAEPLAMTLRYLSSGDLIQDIALAFRVGIFTARMALKVTCHALWIRLQPLYMPIPTTESWLHVAQGFGRTWQFPNCIGAVDGKHVQIKCPKNSGSMFFNYKGTYSIVLLAVVDCNYKFVMIDLPKDLHLPNTILHAPCVLVGDEAFQLRTDLLRPYPGRGLNPSERVFNYRLSRARRCAENAFGILVTRWRILERTMGEGPANAEWNVKAMCVLQNFLMDAYTASEDSYCGPGYANSDAVL